MRRRKVDPLQLQQMLDGGKLQKEMAAFFRVSEGTVSKNITMLKAAKSQDVVLRSASKINEKKINAMERLERIAQRIETELDYIERTMKKTSGEERREWEKTHLGYNAEVRKQISLLREIALTLYNVEEVEAFKQIVLEEIGREDEEIRKRILDRIRSRRTYSGLTESSGLGISKL